MYSPSIPKANNCAPEKTEMMDARKGNPGIVVPCIRYRSKCQHESQNTGDLQRHRAKTGNHVQGMHNKFADRVVRSAGGARPVNDPNSGEALRAPGQQHVDRNIRPAVLFECVAQMRAEDPEGADVACGSRAHGALQGDFGDARSGVAQESMALRQGRAIYHVVALVELGQHTRNLFRRIL
jgi:hypothetical protein